MLSPDDNMLAFGSCLAGTGILATGLLALLFRSPDAPRWTRPELVAMLVCVPVTATIGVGLGYSAYGLLRLVDGTGDARQLLVLAAVLILLIAAWRALGIRRRLKAEGAAAGGSALRPAGLIRPIDAGPPPGLAPHNRSSGKAA